MEIQTCHQSALKSPVGPLKEAAREEGGPLELVGWVSGGQVLGQREDELPPSCPASSTAEPCRVHSPGRNARAWAG